MKTSNRLPALLALACLLPAACTTESHSQIAGPKIAIVTRTLPSKGWEVRDDGRLAGSVLLYEEPGNASAGYYSVRNAQGQVLGMVGLDGRAWRYRLHEPEPEWLGTGTVLEGVRRILGTSALSALDEAELASLAGAG
jgi:hypothetical protein